MKPGVPSQNNSARLHSAPPRTQGPEDRPGQHVVPSVPWDWFGWVTSEALSQGDRSLVTGARGGFDNSWPSPQSVMYDDITRQ